MNRPTFTTISFSDLDLIKPIFNSWLIEDLNNNRKPRLHYFKRIRPLYKNHKSFQAYTDALLNNEHWDDIIKLAKELNSYQNENILKINFQNNNSLSFVEVTINSLFSKYPVNLNDDQITKYQTLLEFINKK